MSQPRDVVLVLLEVKFDECFKELPMVLVMLSTCFGQMYVYIMCKIMHSNKTLCI